MNGLLTRAPRASGARDRASARAAGARSRAARVRGAATSSTPPPLGAIATLAVSASKTIWFQRPRPRWRIARSASSLTPESCAPTSAPRSRPSGGEVACRRRRWPSASSRIAVCGASPRTSLKQRARVDHGPRFGRRSSIGRRIRAATRARCRAPPRASGRAGRPRARRRDSRAASSTSPCWKREEAEPLLRAAVVRARA